MSRSKSLIQFLAIAIGCIASIDASAQVNIVQIVADDLGWVDVSTGLTNYGNGSPYYQTPNIDALAAGGMSFTSAYVLPTCAPTRAALFTGQYAPRNGIHTVGSLNGGGDDTLLIGPDDGEAIKHDAITIAELLQSEGYITAHFGKFHCTEVSDDIVNEHGFSLNIGGTNSGGPNGTIPYFAQVMNGTWRFGSAHGPELDAYAAPYTQQYIDVNLTPYANGNAPNTLVGTPKHLNDAMADAAVDFLEDRINDSQPFFMNVAFNAVHVEVNSRPDLEAKYAGLPTGTNPDHDRADYAGLLEGMDQAIGRIVDFVQDNGLSNDTLIVFVGDNGGLDGMTDNFPLQLGKGRHYEGGIRVPMIAYLPGTVAGGSNTDEAVHVVDFYKTYAELSGAKLPAPSVHYLDGESFAGILTGTQTELNRDSIFYHYPGYSNGNNPLSSIIHDAPNGNRYKLIYYYENRQFEFYDLSNDLSELTDLVLAGMTQEQLEIATTATTILAQWLQDSGAELLTVRASGGEVPLPNYGPAISFDLGSNDLGVGLNGLSNAEVVLLDVTMKLTAEGQSGVFSANTSGVGVNSDLDSGSPQVQRRIDGSLVTPEGIVISFDRDVVLKHMSILQLDADGTESLVLEFVSGENPFLNATEYNSNGFSLGPSSLTLTRIDGDSSPATTVEFGTLDQSEILVKAGTSIRLTADPATNGGFALGSIGIALPRTYAVNPFSFDLTRGSYASGDISDLVSSDNSDFVGQRSSTDVQSRVEIEVKSISPAPKPTSLSFTVEASVFARNAVVQSIEMFDYQLESWEEVDSQNASQFVDSMVTVTPTGDISRFVQSGTHCMEARVRFQSLNPRQRFSANIDQLIWAVQ